jgi:hypothetical protein
MSDTEHHLEEAEHSQHFKHDPFNRRVALTMAIIAATLACVTLASHRAHNERMSQLIEASNRWNYQNTKRSRYHQYQISSDMARVLSATAGTEEGRTTATGLMSDWKKKSEEEKEAAAKEEDKASEHMAKGHHAHHQSNYFDGGELCLEMGLVLCSVALLSRQRWFWFTGIGVSVLGAAVALYGLTVQPKAGHDEKGSHTTCPQRSSEVSL